IPFISKTYRLQQYLLIEELAIAGETKIPKILYGNSNKLILPQGHFPFQALPGIHHITIRQKRSPGRETLLLVQVLREVNVELPEPFIVTSQHHILLLNSISKIH